MFSSTTADSSSRKVYRAPSFLHEGSARSPDRVDAGVLGRRDLAVIPACAGVGRVSLQQDTRLEH
jgi:hypothetical protein